MLYYVILYHIRKRRQAWRAQVPRAHLIVKATVEARTYILHADQIPWTHRRQPEHWKGPIMNELTQLWDLRMSRGARKRSKDGGERTSREENEQLRSVLMNWNPTVSKRGPGIPESLLILTSKCPLKVQTSDGLSPSLHMELGLHFGHHFSTSDRAFVVQNKSIIRKYVKTHFLRSCICLGGAESTPKILTETSPHTCRTLTYKQRLTCGKDRGRKRAGARVERSGTEERVQLSM